MVACGDCFLIAVKKAKRHTFVVPELSIILIQGQTSLANLYCF